MYLVNDIVPWLTSSKNKKFVQNLSGLFDKLFPPSMVVPFPLQATNLQYVKSDIKDIILELDAPFHATETIDLMVASCTMLSRLLWSRITRRHIVHLIGAVIT